MQMEKFHEDLKELMAVGGDKKTVIMCAEAVPLKCHRSLITNAFATRGWEVRHIISEAKANRHQLTSFVMRGNGLLCYRVRNNHLLLVSSSVARKR